MSKIIGIDLGTTKLLCCRHGGPRSARSSLTRKETAPHRQVVAYKNGERIVGDAAKRQAVTNKDTILFH